MRQISSPWTKVYNRLAIVGLLGFTLVSAVFLRQRLYVPSIFIIVLSFISFWNWWRFMRDAKTVFMDDSAIYISHKSGSQRIPFDSLISLYRPEYIRARILVLTYRNSAGMQSQITFFAISRVTEVLTQKIYG